MTTVAVNERVDTTEDGYGVIQGTSGRSECARWTGVKTAARIPDSWTTCCPELGGMGDILSCMA